MDRTVIVLTPTEWEDRKPLAKCLSDAYQELHYTKSSDSLLDALMLSLSFNQKQENMTKEELIDAINELQRIRKDIISHVNKAQTIIGAISTVIDYKERTETVS
jgi:hypothetical protein